MSKPQQTEEEWTPATRFGTGFFCVFSLFCVFMLLYSCGRVAYDWAKDGPPQLPRFKVPPAEEWRR